MPAVCLKGNDSLAELFLLRLQNSPSKEQIVLCQLIIFAFRGEFPASNGIGKQTKLYHHT